MEETNNPMISVIVPIYNVEKYVHESIESILNQTFIDFELIIVDDASPDGSLEICQELAQYDTRIKIIRHTYNQGLGAARNTGMYQSRGKYIAFLDSDDLMVPTALETFYNAAMKNNADVVHCSHYLEREELPDGTFAPQYKKIGDKVPITGMLYADRNKRLLDRYNDFQEWMMVWLNFYRRDFLMKNALKNPRMLSEDNAFHIALLCLTDRYFYVNEALHIYSRRPGSIIKSITRETSVKWAASAVEGVKYIDEIMSRLPEKILSKSTRTQIVCKLMSDLMRRAVFDLYKSEDVFDGEVLNIFLQALRPYFDQNIRLAAYFLQNYAANRFWHNDQVAKWNAQRKTSDALKKTNAALQKTNDSLKKSNAALTSDKNFLHRLVNELPHMLGIWDALKNSKPRVILLSVPRHGNIGDHAITLGERVLLSESFSDHAIIEVPTDYFNGRLGDVFTKLNYTALIGKDDVIFIHGGGNLGTLWPMEETVHKNIIRKFPDNKIIIMPQSIFFDEQNQKAKGITTDTLCSC